MLASNQLFTSDFYFNTLNSPVYANLTSDITAWLNNAFSALPTDRIYSINFVAYVYLLNLKIFEFSLFLVHKLVQVHWDHTFQLVWH